MNPNADSSPGMRLPEPLPVNPNSGVEHLLKSDPHAATNTTTAQESSSYEAAPSQFAAPIDPTPGATSQDASAMTLQVAAPANADDSDTIEKEWVVKAKQIVQATHADPYQQNRQLAAFKADYLKKRYNKIVKLSE